MIEFHICNYCKLKDAERLAKAQGKILLRVQDTDDMGGLGYGESIHLVYDSSEEISQENFLFWGQEIPDRCCC